MIILQKEVIAIEKEHDVIFFRNRIKEMASKIGMGLVNQTKLITAASELVRNMLRYANGGKVTINIVSHLSKSGLQLVFADKGPGIRDISLAMKEGYSTDKSLGLGLPGAKKLADEFDIKTVVGKGTTVTILKWKNGR